MKTDADLMHGKAWTGQDLTGWVLQEKFDGVRGFWDGVKMWTRGGHEVAIPEHWRAHLPGQALDCEIFAGYGQFEAARVSVRTGAFHPACRLIVFDAPLKITYRARVRYLEELMGTLPEGCVPPVTICRGNHHALDLMEECMERGGEGLIARDPANLYHAGRTGELRKLKTPRHEMWFLKR